LRGRKDIRSCKTEKTKNVKGVPYASSTEKTKNVKGVPYALSRSSSISRSAAS
jgi:hypothetical protein